VILSARDMTKAHGLTTLFTNVSLSIIAGERIGFIGPNGAGKSTLLKIIAGHEPADEGTITLARGMRVIYVPQHDRFADASSGASGEERSARAICAAAALNHPAAPAIPAPDDDHHHAYAHDRYEAEVMADMTLARLGFDDNHANAPASALSGGWRKRLSIACGLAQCAGEPDLLLLDEPTNHLDVQGITWLEDFLSRPPAGRTPFASMFVTHDRQFLESVSTRIIELSAAYPDGTFSAPGNYSQFLVRRQDYLDGQQRAQQSLANQVRIDAAWLARGAKARRTKSKSRISASFERMDELAELGSRNAVAAGNAARVDFTSTDRQTKKLVSVRHASVTLGGRALFSDVTFHLGVGDVIGLFGPNGSGKTTMIRLLCGEIAPDDRPNAEGQYPEVRRADPPPRIVVFSQHRGHIDPATLLSEALCPVGNQLRFRGQAMHITAWSRRFLFRDEQLMQPVGSLSGGELARVHIARIMLEQADVLILDEPTNDLDIPTLEVLEEALEDFPGAVVLVTHDRAMMDRLATDVLALDGLGGHRMVATLEQAVGYMTGMIDAADAKAAAEQAVRTKANRAAQKAAEVEAADAPAKPGKRKKLAYKEQREFDAMEENIMAGEERVAALERMVSDPAVLADHVAMTKTCADLGAQQAEVGRLYARWQELEAKQIS